MTPLLRATPNCWICGRPAELENCKIDEHGQPMHEHCYVAKLVSDGKEDKFPSFPCEYKTSA